MEKPLHIQEQIKQVLGYYYLSCDGCVGADMVTAGGWLHSHSAVGHIVITFITKNLKKHEKELTTKQSDSFFV